ncbi:hypothetical protein ACFQZ0_35390 [Streptomyces erythrogriseus]
MRSGRTSRSRRPVRFPEGPPRRSAAWAVAASTRKSSTSPEDETTGVSSIAGTGSAANNDWTASASPSGTGTAAEVKLRTRPAHSRATPRRCARSRGAKTPGRPRSTPMHTSEPSPPRRGSQTRDCHRSGGSPISM